VIRRYPITKNTSITNQYGSLSCRMTGSNTGWADSLELFKIAGQFSSSSFETSRALVDYDINAILADRDNGLIPSASSYASGLFYGPKFWLKLFHVDNAVGNAREFRMCVVPVSKSWDAGNGVDLDERLDLDSANWRTASVQESGYIDTWTIPGVSCGEQVVERFIVSGTREPDYFDSGLENFSQCVSAAVYDRIHNNAVTGGFLFKLEHDYCLMSGDFSFSSSACSSSQFADTKYTKRFSARESEFYLKRPILECQWDDSVIDSRGEFWVSASDGGETNSQVLSFYNFKNNAPQMVDSSTPVNLLVRIYDDPISGSMIAGPVSASMPSYGFYTASLAIYTTSSLVYDRWFDVSTSSLCYYTGSVKMRQLDYGYLPIVGKKYHFTMPDLRDSYSNEGIAKFRVVVYDDNFAPNNYSTALAGREIKFIPYVFYRISRTIDKFAVIDYGTGSYSGYVTGSWNTWANYCLSTRLSQEASGNYFNMDMSLFEPGFLYDVSFLYGLAKHDPNLGDIYLQLEEAEQKFHFRVESEKWT
jgi:hypothetical protein